MVCSYYNTINTFPRPIQQRNLPMQTQTKKSLFRKTVLLVDHLDDAGKPVKNGSVIININEDSANVASVESLIKESISSTDDYVVIDVNGFEIKDSPATRGT